MFVESCLDKSIIGILKKLNLQVWPKKKNLRRNTLNEKKKKEEEEEEEEEEGETF